MSADPGLVKRLSVFASGASVFSMAIGLSGLSGWVLHLSRLTTWGFAPVKMVANTAACFVLLGVSLWLLRRRTSQTFSRARNLAAKALAAIAGVFGLLSLVEHLFAVNLGIDQILVRAAATDQAAGVSPGLMSSLTALNFFLLGFALVLLDRKTQRDDWPAQFLCLGAALPTAFGLAALLLEPGASPTSMAWPTAVTFSVLISGVLCSRADWAIGGLLTSQNSGARLARRATPAALLVLSVIGWAISKPLLTGSHFTWVEVSALAVFSSALLAGFIAWMAFLVERSDSQRRKVEEAFKGSQEELDRLLNRVEEPEAEWQLRRKVTAGFAVAVLLTGLLGFLSWRASRQSEEDAGWVAHTREVSTTLELMLRHLVDVETGGRGFALTGDEVFLEPSESGKHAVAQDLQKLSTLIASNSEQRRRLDLLGRQANDRIEASEGLVASRQQSGNIADAADLRLGKQLMDATRATVAEMEAEEERLLEERSQSARSAQHLSVFVIALGSVVGVVFLSIAGYSVSREIGISAKARAQVIALNADLEKRVAQRTEALGESEGRLAGVIQSAMDAILTVDERQNILLFNSAAERMFRCPASEALGQPLTRFIPQRFHAAHAGHIHKFAGTGVTSRAVGSKNALWALRADGQEFQIEASISQVVTGGRKLFTVILRDVTERVQVEAVRDCLAAIVDSSDDAIISKDMNGTINAWNRGAEKVFGYSAAEAIGKPMVMLFPRGRVNEEADILDRIRHGESVEHFETVRVRRDGTNIDISATISPIRDASGRVIGASKIARDITERKRAQDALRQSDARREFALKTARVGDWDLDLNTLEATRSSLHDQIFGYQSPLPEWSFEIFLRHVDPNDRERVRENFQGSVNQQKKWEFECRIVWPNGEIRWIWACGDQNRDSSGKATRMFGIVQDITERKQAEETLRRQAEELSQQTIDLVRTGQALEAQSRMLKLVLDSVGEGLIAADRDGHFLIWNDSAKRLMGRGATDLASDQWTPHYKVFLPDGTTPYPPEDLPLVRAMRGESVRLELMVEHPERAGGVYLEVSARPMKDAGGSPCGGVAVLRDITEHRQAEAALARQAEELVRSQQALETQTLMLQSVLDSIGEGLVAADETGKFILWNPAAMRIVGMGAANVPPEQWTDHYGTYLPDTVTPFPPEQNPLLRAIHGETCTTEMYVRNAEMDTGVWIESTGSPLKSRDGAARGGVVAFRDITQRRADEREIRKLNEELEERVAQRTAQLAAANHELEAFTYSVSHDLRAPLRHIGGFSRILMEDFSSSMAPEAQHHLQRIEDGARRMGLLVDELLNLARVGRYALNFQVTNLNLVVEEVVSQLQPETEGRVVSWKVAELPSTKCDPILIKQVFQNLLANAIKFTRPRELAVIEISQRQKNGQTVIAVRDNGVGFNMEYVDKLFGVFQRLHRAEEFEGTGIGLATVQRIVHKHGGQVWAEAELDKGATFYFTLGAESADVKSSEGKSKAATAGAEI
jgi:PAS domain S-box-containing protein